VREKPPQFNTARVARERRQADKRRRKEEKRELKREARESAAAACQRENEARP
jgi:hypothetical protein